LPPSPTIIGTIQDILDGNVTVPQVLGELGSDVWEEIITTIEDPISVIEEVFGEEVEDEDLPPGLIEVIIGGGVGGELLDWLNDLLDDDDDTPEGDDDGGLLTGGVDEDEDTGQPPTDTGEPPTDDTGAPPADDTGVPPTDDTGVPSDDTGVPSDTGGVPSEDDTDVPSDTGTPPDDTGVPPDDTGVPPDDTGVPQTILECLLKTLEAHPDQMVTAQLQKPEEHLQRVTNLSQNPVQENLSQKTVVQVVAVC
jgi:hypothetical protein